MMNCLSVEGPLAGCRAKLLRAAEHLQTFDDEISEFIERQRHGLVGEYDSQTRCYSFKITMVEQPTLRTGVIVGDIVHNLRSALDHLVWQLVIRAGRTPHRRNAFPMFDNSREFEQQVTIPGRRGRPNPLFGLEGTPAWTAIERLQPYHGATAHRALSALHTLSNEDKHRVVLQAATAVEHPGPRPTFRLRRIADVGKVLSCTVRMGRALEDGAEIMSVELVPTGPNPQMEVEGTITLDIAFGESRVRMTAVPKMAELVHSIVGEFGQQFF